MGKKKSLGLSSDFMDKVLETIENKVDEKVDEKVENGIRKGLEKAGKAKYKVTINDVDTEVDGKQVVETAAKEITEALKEKSIEAEAKVTIVPEATVDDKAVKDTAKKTLAYIKDAVEGTKKPVEIDTNINNIPLQERLKYLQKLRKESKFLETAEERRIEMEEKAWDAGGNRPRSEADSQNKIRQYEELVEHIGKANTAVDEFGDKYEKVIIKFKDGSEEIVETVLELDKLSLAAKKIQDIQFFQNSSAESIKENIEAQKKGTKATEENAQAQQEQKAAAEANNQAQSEAQQESNKTAEAEKKEAEAHRKNADAIEKEAEAKKQLIHDIGNGIYKNQTGKVGDNSWGYTERIGYAQDALVRISHDKNGNMLVSETLKTNYKALENEILKVEKAIVDTQAKMDELSSKGINTSASQRNLDKLKTYLGELDDELSKYYSSAEYVPSTNQEASFAARRQEAIEIRENEKEQTKAVRERKAVLEEEAAIRKQIAEIQERQLAAEEAEYQQKRSEYIAEGKQQEAEYYAERQRKTKEYENIFFNTSGKLNEVDFAPNTEALRNSNALYDELVSKIHEFYDLKEAILKIDENTKIGQYDIAEQQKKINSLTSEIEETIKQISAAEAVQESRESELLDITLKREAALKDISTHSDLQSRDDMDASVSKWIDDVEKLQLSQKYTDDFLKSLSEVKIKLESFSSASGSIKQVSQAFKELEDDMDRINSQKGLSEFKKAQSASIAKLNLQIEEFVRKNTRMGKDFETKFNALKLEWDTSVSTQRIQELVAEFAKLKSEVTAADKLGASFFTTLRQRAMGVNAQLIAQYLSWQDMIRYARQGFEVIQELDDALVDLRKTTAMNEDELNAFYLSSNKTAKEMGVTTKEIIEQASAWSRLGYNTAETSETMAALSSQFASISPGMTTEEAQTGLVSLMKAYKVTVDDVERDLMDNINVLGNKFAETNLDIIEGMERAGATLSAIGTSVEDSFALFTGAQEIIQNAETVGTALKTLSLRIRGFDEETEQLSEDVVAATGKVADLTKTASNNYAGVSLWADAEQTRYRSLVEYLGDIASIWDEIGEKNQTDLLNNLFGKRGASVGSAIIQNFDQVKNALTEMENAAGAADSEMEIIKTSISYKLNELKQTWVGILQEMIDRGQINDLIDGLIKLSENIGKIIEAIGPFPTLIAGFGLKTLILNLDKIPDAINGIRGAIDFLGTSSKTTEIFLGETDDAISAVGKSSKKTAGLVTILKNALNALKAHPIIAVLAVAVGAGIYAFNKLNVTVEETQKDIDDANSKISDFKSEMEELQSIENPTDGQKKRLSLLEDELKIQEAILEAAEKRQLLELSGSKLTDYLDKDNWNTKISSFENQNPNTMTSTQKFRNFRFDDVSKEYAELQDRIHQLNENLDNTRRSVNEHKQDREAFKKAEDRLNSLQRETYENYEQSLSDYADLKTTATTIEEQLSTLSEEDPLYNTLKNLSDRYNVQIKELEEYILQVENMLGLSSYITDNANFREYNKQLIGQPTLAKQEEINAITEATKDFTTEQKRAWITVTAGAQDGYEAIQKWNESLQETLDTTEQLVPEAEKLYNSISYEEFSTNLTSKLESLNKSFSSFIEDVKSGDQQVMDLDSLESMRKDLVATDTQLGVTAKEFKAFEDVVGNSNSSVTEMQDAYGLLATQLANVYFDSVTDQMKELDDETKQFIKDQLELKGYTEESVDAYVEYRAQLKAVAAQTKDNIESTQEEIKQRQLEINIRRAELANVANGSNRGRGNTISDELKNAKASLKELRTALNDEYTHARELGVDLSRTVYQNIDTNNRELIRWTDENIEKYKDALLSYVDKEKMTQEEIKRYLDSYRGSFSSVDASSNTFTSHGQAIDIAFTPLLQTGTGTPVYLDEHTVNTYIQTILDKVGPNLDPAKIQILDAQGLEIEGQYIKNLIAGIGDEARLVAESMHFTGSSGAIEDLKNAISETEKEIKTLTDSLDDIPTSSLKEATDEISSLREELSQLEKDEALLKFASDIDTTTNSLIMYTAQLMVANNTDLNNETSVNELQKLMTSSGLTTEVIAKLIRVMEIYQTIASGVLGTNNQAVAQAKAEIADILNEVKNLEASGKVLDPDPTKVKTKGSKGSSGSSKDTYLEAYKEEKEKLKSEREAGLIDEATYLDKLKALIDKFFKDRAKYAKNYIDEMKEYLEGVKSLYDSAISGVTTIIQKKIDAANKGKDAAVKALNEEKEAAEERYQAEIDAIQAQMDALDDLIEKKNDEKDAIQDQIDAINDANAARDRSLQLQKAEYELQRSMNQRTKLVKFMPTNTVMCYRKSNYIG